MELRRQHTLYPARKAAKLQLTTDNCKYTLPCRANFLYRKTSTGIVPLYCLWWFSTWPINDIEPSLSAREKRWSSLMELR